MRVYVNDIIPKIQRYSQKLDDITILTQNRWVLIDDTSGKKVVYMFRPNYELLVSVSGKVYRGKWEYLEPGSILIENSEGPYLFRQKFIDDVLLALGVDKADSIDEYVLFLNENNYCPEVSISVINSYLEDKYL